MGSQVHLPVFWSHLPCLQRQTFSHLGPQRLGLQVHWPVTSSHCPLGWQLHISLQSGPQNCRGHSASSAQTAESSASAAAHSPAQPRDKPGHGAPAENPILNSISWPPSPHLPVHFGCHSPKGTLPWAHSQGETSKGTAGALAARAVFCSAITLGQSSSFVPRATPGDTTGAADTHWCHSWPRSSHGGSGTRRVSRTPHSPCR